jgi:hypothetical protein
MNQTFPQPILLKVYSFSVILALTACIYALLKPGISSPIYPKEKMDQALKAISSEPLISSSETKLDKDSSERKFSALYTYNYKDGSKVLATIARVKKRDDFKIETYGLLTKNIDPIYLKSPSFVNSIPASLSGMIGKDKYIQTCIVPKSTKLDENDFRLNNLTSIVEKLNPRPNTLMDKVMGTKKNIDYSCLVLTYKPARTTNKFPPANWEAIVMNVQAALTL